MSRLVIEGGRPLEGEVLVQGAKNAVLPILAATLLNSGRNVIKNCPRLSDVKKTIEILKGLGCRVKQENNVVIVDSSQMNNFTICEELMRQMRSSIIFLGAIIGACGEARVSMPGGCEIGSRPIDLHLKALEQMGVDIKEEHGYIYCCADNISGADIHLDFPSVGATENIMLAAVKSKGATTIRNAAREPEIVDLARFLNRMGARISGAGESVIYIEGTDRLYEAEYTIMPDRIAAATYLLCGMITGGKVAVKRCVPEDNAAVLSALRTMGAGVRAERDIIYTYPVKELKSPKLLRTMPYPGFPTDIQSPFMSLCSIAGGTTVFVETIFENRFRQVDELVRMGADIRVEGRTAVIRGVKKLFGATVEARELRGGASLVAAALAAEGESVIEHSEYIDRGYENIEKNLRALGADIKRGKE